MKVLVKLVVILCCLGVVACGETEEEVDNDDGDETVEGSLVVSELDDDQADEVCGEHPGFEPEGLCAAGLIEDSLVPGVGPGDPPDYVESCENGWDDCVGDETHFYHLDYPDCELEEIDRAECEVTVDEVRDCWAEAGDAFDQLTEQFECSDMDDVDMHEERYTDAIMDGEACQAMEEDCEEFLPGHYEW